MCPTEDTKKNLIEKEVFDAKSLHVLHDPIIEVKNISQLKKEQITQKLQNKNYILNIGRLTKQKNQKLLIEAFSKILKIDPTLYLVILGEGELEKELKEFAKKKTNLQ